MFFKVNGTTQLRDLARDLKREGEVGMARRLRRNITAEAESLKGDVARAALAIPASTHNPRQPSLRASIAGSLRISVSPMIRNGAGVRLIADGKRMPMGMQSLTAYEEGSDGFRSLSWRHMLWGDEQHWFPQASHPYFMPTVMKHLPALAAAIGRVADETAVALAAK